MKQFIRFAVSFLILGNIFLSCKKAGIKSPATTINKPPIANAGADTVFILPCSYKTGFAELDGTRSYDPDNNIARYNWVVLYGPPGYVLTDPNSAKVTVENISPGIYAFQLTVTDLGGLFSRDTVSVSVNGNSAAPYVVDILLNASLHFLDNYMDPYEGDTYYYDETYMRGTGIIQPFGEFEVGVYEFADSAASSDILYSNSLHITKTTSNSSSMYVSGDLSGVNFKKLIREGGGLFSGTFTVTSGSARSCGAMFGNLPPLTVTGSLDVATRTVTLSIRGKVYF